MSIVPPVAPEDALKPTNEDILFGHMAYDARSLSSLPLPQHLLRDFLAERVERLEIECEQLKRDKKELRDALKRLVNTEWRRVHIGHAMKQNILNLEDEDVDRLLKLANAE